MYLALNPITSEVYVSDRPTASIYVYDAAGTYQRTFEPPAGIAGWQPLGVWFDAAGNLFVTDVGASPNVIRQFDAAGQQVRTFGEDAGMNFPNGVATDAAGNVYVTDSNNGRLLAFSPDGTLVAQIGRGSGEGNLGLPRGVAVDGQGRVYVVDTSGQARLRLRHLPGRLVSPGVPGILREPGRRRTVPSPTPTASRSTAGGGCTSPTRPTTACSCGATDANGREGGGRRSHSVEPQRMRPHV